ncbi:hypothetical protein BDE02_01G401300 [Populus trichocarpa]|nr:hypothetical protein BDE02_01G401300 [Populus trichocarpa]
MLGVYSATCKWTVQSFPRVKARASWSKYFEVGGYGCRLLIYPKGDSQALPGYISIYLQIMDPRGTSSSKWDCFASYRLSIVNPLDDSKTIHRDSWHRFSNYELMKVFVSVIGLKFNALNLQNFEEAKSSRQVMLATDESCKHWYSQSSRVTLLYLLSSCMFSLIHRAPE